MCLQLFTLFWPIALNHKIVDGTNQYATILNVNGQIQGGRDWKELTLEELKAFLAICSYMRMRKQPNIKSYWQ